MYRSIAFACFVTLAVAQQQRDRIVPDAPVECKNNRDFLPDPNQCDKYYECTEAGPVEHLCSDGLVFDDTRNGNENCDYPFNVECGERLELQPPTSGSIECPRLNGIFAHEDPSVCNVFYLCVGGVHQTYTCDGELHFNEYTGVCEWENVAGRTGCQVKSNALADGFTCPQNNSLEVNGVQVIHPLYAHPQDCQKFYICLNGKDPRENACPDLTVFNDIAMKCDDPANVPGCENWFEPLDEEPKPAAGNKNNGRRRR